MQREVLARCPAACEFGGMGGEGTRIGLVPDIEGCALNGASDGALETLVRILMLRGSVVERRCPYAWGGVIESD